MWYLEQYGFLGNSSIRVFIQRLIKFVDKLLGLE